MLMQDIFPHTMQHEGKVAIYFKAALKKNAAPTPMAISVNMFKSPDPHFLQAVLPGHKN